MKQPNDGLPGQHRMCGCLIFVAQEPFLRDGKLGWHLSISHPRRLPTYAEMKRARYQFLPNNVDMAQLFPPTEEFVNLHERCLHLWEIEK
jgi:hypothetical protein